MSEDPATDPGPPGDLPRAARNRRGLKVRDAEPRPSVRWRGGTRRQALYFIVLGMLAVGLLLVLFDQWRKGLVVMGTSILLGGIARAVLPTRLVGWLAVRNRSSDLVVCIALGAALIVTAVVARGEI